MEKEIWKDIDGYNGVYKISNLGRVKSYNRYKDGIIMKQTKASHGYYTVKLYKNKKSTCYNIHRLIAEHFIENPNNHPCVLHKDDNKENNNIKNLRWGSYSDNMKDKINNFGIKSVRHNKALNKKDVLKIRHMYKSNKISQKKLGDMFGVTQQAIWHIVNNNTWKDV